MFRLEKHRLTLAYVEHGETEGRAAAGSGVPNRNKVGKVSKQQVEEIAKTKLPDLNAGSLEAAMRVVEGTARSMGIEVQ